MTNTLRDKDFTLNQAIQAIEGEIAYQDALPRRSEDEAKDLAGYLTLLQRYVRKAQDEWADNEGPEAGLHQLRKCAAIAVRGMVYCGIERRAE